MSIALEPVSNSGWVEISHAWVFGALGLTAFAILLFGSPSPWLPAVMALELGLTVMGVFLFSSLRYRIHKNAVTFGMALVILSTFFHVAWPGSELQDAWRRKGLQALPPLVERWLLSWNGLDQLFHADTMLFILGLTLLVSIVAESRLLETISIRLLQSFRGSIFPAVLATTALVGVASGILGGASTIGILLRTLAIHLFMVKADVANQRFTVLVCSIVTTVCPIWLGYGGPTNVIIKVNVVGPTGQSLLTDSYFLTWCMPLAIVSFGVIGWNLSRRLKGLNVDSASIDVLDAHVATVRFLQAERHGRIYAAIELIGEYRQVLGPKYAPLLSDLSQGRSLGEAMVGHGLSQELRLGLLSILTNEPMAVHLDDYYVRRATSGENATYLPEGALDLIREASIRMYRAQRYAVIALAAFVLLLVGHSISPGMPLFIAPFAAGVIAGVGIARSHRILTRVLHEANHEYREYYFLFPLFLSISLLKLTGFFASLQNIMLIAIDSVGVIPVALMQFVGCTFLSTVIDNTIVADLASRMLNGMAIGLVYLFATAQIAGYALGGCWTHIGSVQSIIAFVFIQRNIDMYYAPIHWIRDITPLVIQIFVLFTILLIFFSVTLL